MGDLSTSKAANNPDCHLKAINADLNRLSLSPRLRELVSKVQSGANSKILVAYPSDAGLIIPETDLAIHVWFEMAAHYESFATQTKTWIHCFGFDNSFYYLLFIPALLRAMNPEAKLPDYVLTNEFLLLDGAKFSMISAPPRRPCSSK